MISKEYTHYAFNVVLILSDEAATFRMTILQGKRHIDEDIGMEINIGLSKQERGEIAAGLSKVLADSYTLYLKTHNFHWNVEGPLFQTLHLQF